MSRTERDELDANLLRRALSCFPSGVVAVGRMVDALPAGMAVSSFTSVSLDPPLILICAARESATWQSLRGDRPLGLSILSRTHAAACRQLAGPTAGRFTGLAWRSTPDGAVLLDGASLWLECRIEREVTAGDHIVVLLAIEAVEAAADEPPPLVFHRSSFHHLTPV
jgi:flavin reductase (DIM6/NTAB) family NADH-FMN oxidoreductase RutF